MAKYEADIYMSHSGLGIFQVDPVGCHSTETTYARRVQASYGTVDLGLSDHKLVY
eukprot:TRINITY_DN2767_c0_g1_i1.p3 TRINITY_DN2767_c0_g1~~TRINITY_DN2767_c0_g1_i1.p3  ORF type:complete len:55 (+),score=1.24 TRINITY_DN2767_c0_g1_i1:52-216(+)